MNYNIKLKKSDEGFAVWCDNLPGCASQGETEEDAIQNIKEAIKEYIEIRKELIENEKKIIVEVY
jgi:predicted RNase H-like HicB family nuclease